MPKKAPKITHLISVGAEKTHTSPSSRISMLVKRDRLTTLSPTRNRFSAAITFPFSQIYLTPVEYGRTVGQNTGNYRTCRLTGESTWQNCSSLFTQFNERAKDGVQPHRQAERINNLVG